MHSRRMWLTLLICASLTRAGSAAHALPADGEPTPFPSAGLSLVLSVDKTALLVGEPAAVHLRIENRGDQTVTGDFYPSYGLDRVRITITSQGGAPLSYMSEAMAIASLKKRGAALVTLAPGASVTGDEFVSYDAGHNEFAFATAGQYTLQATLDIDFHRQQLTSNAVVLQVTAPAGLDARALAFIEAHGLKPMLTPEAGLMPMDHGAVARLRAFLLAYGASTYAQYTRTGLASICGVGLDPLACAPTSSCSGDCSGDGIVTIDELVTGVDIALGTAPLDRCRAFDCNGAEQVTIDCLVQAVSHALNGCHSPPAPTP